MIVKLNLLQLSTVDQYKKEFCRLSKKKLAIDNIPLIIFPEDFEHACYEYLERGVYKGKFSRKRARRLPVIEQIINKEIPSQIIFQTNRKKKTVAFVSETAECCLIVLPATNNGRNFFRFVTIIAFGKGIESGPKKIYQSGKKIKRSALKSVFPKEKES